ncbi:MAG: choice-of-anchor J domain-containing protein, partial [Ignavibacterium sp.]|nr:choice-of-anchor J domain-containing protein [Ignavibacterium sp.]
MKRAILLFFSLCLISVSTFSQDNASRTNMVDTWISIQHNSDGMNAIFMDDMNGDNTLTGIQSRGWAFDNVDGGGTTTVFQGNPAVFNAYEGPTDGYIGMNYNGANGLIMNQWLISPTVTVTTGDTLKFWHRSPDGSTYPDHLEVWVSTTGGTTGAAFDVQLASFDGSTTGWQQFVGYFPTTGTVRFGIKYYSTNGGVSGSETDYVGFDYFEVLAGGSSSLITIAQAIEDLNNDFVPDRLGDTVTVQGVVFSPNYQTTNNSFYIYDGTAGTDIFMYSPPLYHWNMGDELNITGVVTQYNGMSEIVAIDSTGWVLMSTGNPTPDPMVLTLAQFKANAELYEGSLVGFIGLNKVGGTWPASGSSANLSLSDGVDTVVFRIDSDTDIDGSPEPTWPVDVIGIGSQFDNSVPYSSGYQVFPRFFASDFLPAGSLPVELTSFSANVNNSNVNLDWSTATETNNNGFQIERSAVGGSYQVIGFVAGYGTTTEAKHYSFVDQNVAAGNYTYRLKQVDFNGTFEYSNTIEVEVIGVKEFALGQNYPNPFNPST